MSHSEETALMAHLMRRAGFGSPRAELRERVTKGYEETVEELLEPEKYGIPENDEMLLFRHFPNAILPGGQPWAGQANWLWQMINTARPLQEKMTLFWHMVFATGSSKIDNTDQMMTHINLFRRQGLGNYRHLLVELAKNPAMIYWLDNNENHKDRLNENWGRELLELFSMGQGNYTEEDVYECARAFTGWTISRKLPRFPFGRFPWHFIYDEDDHDDSEKNFLGQAGRFNGEDVIDIIVQQPATARFIARHLYNFFVADEVPVPSWLDTPPRDQAAVDAIADAFVSSGYQIKDTLRVIFNSEFFKNARFQKVKNPLEVVVGTMNLVGDFKGFPKPGLVDLGLEPGHMGQAQLDPPSVEGWHTGAEWIDTGSLVRRINFVADRVRDLTLPGVRDIVDEVKAARVATPEQLLETCLDLIGPIEVGEETHEELARVAEQAGELRWDTEEEAIISEQRVADMLSVIVASKEYQFC